MHHLKLNSTLEINLKQQNKTRNLTSLAYCLNVTELSESQLR